MSNYPHNNTSGYPYGAPPPSQSYPYGGPPPPNQPSSYGGPPPPNQPSPYGAPPPPNQPAPYAPVATPYGAPSAPPKDNYGAPPQQHSQYGGYPAPPPSAPYGSPFASLMPSAFPPGTDPNVIACFQVADQDGSGFIDDKELQRALTSYNQNFGLRTVHLLMYHFTNSNVRKIGDIYVRFWSSVKLTFG